MRKRKPVKESERERTHVDSERPYTKTQVNPEMVLTLELRNIGQILGTYWEILCKYCENIAKGKYCANIGQIMDKYSAYTKKVLSKYWVNIRHIFYKNWENIVQILGKYLEYTGQILGKYWTNIVYILCKYWANIVDIL